VHGAAVAFDADLYKGVLQKGLRNDDWFIEGVQAGLSQVVKVTGREYSRLTVELLVRRKWTNEIFRCYAPVTILLCLAYLSVYVDPLSVPARTTLTMVCLLSSIMIYAQLEKSSGSGVSYVDALGVWTILSASTALMIFLRVHWLQRKEDSLWEAQMAKEAAVAMGLDEEEAEEVEEAEEEAVKEAVDEYDGEVADDYGGGGENMQAESANNKKLRHSQQEKRVERQVRMTVAELQKAKRLSKTQGTFTSHTSKELLAEATGAGKLKSKLPVLSWLGLTTEAGQNLPPSSRMDERARKLFPAIFLVEVLLIIIPAIGSAASGYGDGVEPFG